MSETGQLLRLLWRMAAQLEQLQKDVAMLVGATGAPSAKNQGGSAYSPGDRSSLRGWYDPSLAGAVKSNGAADFNGTDMRMESSNMAAVNVGTSDFWCAFEIKLDSTASQQWLVGPYTDSTHQLQIQTNTSGQIRCLGRDGGSFPIVIDGSTNLGTTNWRRVVVICDRDSAANSGVYLDGTEDTSGTPTVDASDLDHTHRFYVASRGADFLNGKMQNLMWGTASDIGAVFADIVSTFDNGGDGPGGASLVVSDLEELDGGGNVSVLGAWNLSERSGNRLDSSGNGVTLTDIGSTGEAVGNGEHPAAGGEPISRVTNREAGQPDLINDDADPLTRPTYLAAGINSRGTIEFDGSDDYLKTDGNITLAGLHACVVVDTADAAAIILEQSVNAASNDGFNLDTANPCARINGASANATIAADAAWDTGSAHIAELRGHDGSDLEALKDGASAGTQSTDPGTLGAAVLYVGARAGSSRFLAGQVGEITLDNDDLSSQDATGNRAYLTGRWL